MKDGIKVQIYDEQSIDTKCEDYLSLTREANNVINLAIGDSRKREILLKCLSRAKEEFQEGTDSAKVQMLIDNTLETSIQTRAAKRSITMFNKTHELAEINILNLPMAKTKGSGRGGRPKLGIAKRLKSDFELLSKKPWQCKKCGLVNAGHDSRNCPKDCKGKAEVDVETSSVDFSVSEESD
jgi:hypothetical protein